MWDIQMIYENESLRITLPLGPLPGMYETLWGMGIITEGGVSGEFASNPQVAQGFINGYTADNALHYEQARVTDAINKLTKKKFDAVVADTSAAEMAAWPILRHEMLTYMASGNVADCPSIVQEAQDRGLAVDALVAKVKTNVDVFQSLRAGIAGIGGKHRDAVKALINYADVAAYDYTVGWPV